MFVTINDPGHISTAYGRRENAEANAGGLDVVLAPPEVIQNHLAWRYDRAKGVWVREKQPRELEDIRTPKTYVGRRRKAYSELLETDRQFEAIVEAINALVEAHRSGVPAPADAFKKLDALNQQIAAVKKDHPRD